MIDIRKIFRNLFSVSIMRLLTAAFSFLLFSILARKWGATSLGEFSTVFAFFMFLLQIPLMGLHIVVAREVAADPDSAKRCGTNALLISLPVSFFIALLVGMAGEYFYHESMHPAFWLVGLACPLMAFTVVAEAVLTGQEKMQVISWVTIAETIFRVAVCLTLVLLDFGLTALFVAFLGARVVAVFVYWTRGGINNVVRFNESSLAVVVSYLKQCPTFLGILLLSVGIGRFDFIFLSLLGSMHDVGLYSPPFKIYEIGLMVPSVVTLVLFPAFARAFAQSKTLFNQLYESMFRITFTVGLPLVILLSSLSIAIIPTIFGVEYASGAFPLQVLSFAILFVALDQVLTVVVLAGHREDLELKILTISFTLYLTLLLLLIPTFGFYGAAIATCVTSGFKVSFRYFFVRKTMAIPPSLKFLRQPVMASFVMILVLYAVPDAFLLLSQTLAMIAYAGVLVWTGGLTAKDVVTFKSMFAEQH